MNEFNEMQISEAELRAMTSDLKQMHEDTFPAVEKALGGFRRGIATAASKSASRRGFLVGGATVIGGATLAACGSNKKSATPAASESPYTGDLKVVALAAALENLAVAAYGMALDAAGKGTYGKVPAAIGEFITVAKAQHADHAKGWNAVLTGAGKPAVTNPSLTITDGAVKALMAAKTIPAVAEIALGLESSAAQTYTFATANVTDPSGIAVAASIAPVEAQHAAILSFVLGKYPAPDSFLGISMAVQPSALTV